MGLSQCHNSELCGVILEDTEDMIFIVSLNVSLKIINVRIYVSSHFHEVISLHIAVNLLVDTV